MFLPFLSCTSSGGNLAAHRCSSRLTFFVSKYRANIASASQPLVFPSSLSDTGDDFTTEPALTHIRLVQRWVKVDGEKQPVEKKQ
jgi:hypothetical protein